MRTLSLMGGELEGDDTSNAATDRTFKMEPGAPSASTQPFSSLMSDSAGQSGRVWFDQGNRRDGLDDEDEDDKGKGKMTYNAFDPQGTAHLRTVAAPSESANSVVSGWEPWKAVPSNRPARAREPYRKNPGFAKIPVSGTFHFKIFLKLIDVSI